MAGFKFRFYRSNEEGEIKGMWGKRGSIDEHVLLLHKTEIPILAIADIANRGNHLVIRVLGTDDEHYDVFIRSAKAEKIRAEIGRLLSANWAANHRQQLIETGDGEEFRVETCPSCRATINLSFFPLTPQVHCIYCNTISTFEEDEFEDQTAAQPEKGFGLCEECEMFAKPRQFTILYIYFLVYLYGWYSRPTWRCPPCMRKDAWKMLFGNLIFILGVPTALIQLFRSYGGTSIGGKYAGLDRANLLARKGRLEKAVEAYRQILQKHPTAAGVKYNLGLTFLSENRIEEAARMFEYVLQDCSNYPPAAETLALCYEELGETEKLDELKKNWSQHEDEEEILPEEFDS